MQADTLLTRLRRLVFPLAAPPGILAMSLLGCLCGIIAGLAISALHALIDLARVGFDGLHITAIPELPAVFLAPLLGGLLLGLIYQLIRAGSRSTGLVHIVERLQHHQGYLPTKNALSNFFGSAIAIGSGQMVGREGAAMHLGAAGGSWLSRRLELPYSTGRALVGCGAAAGIAASFNTPLAGVIFAMEVIIMEYTVMGLAPTIIAAVSANAVAHVWLQSHPTLTVSVTQLDSYGQLPTLLIVGAILGLISVWYSQSMGWLSQRTRTLPIWSCMAATGLITGMMAWGLPLAAVDGFASMNAALAGQLSLFESLGLAAVVLVGSSLAIASGIPGGIIMPSMLAGACLGAALGHMGSLALGTPDTYVALYALLGMAAMMGAVLQAPLTALIVVLELSGHTGMVFAAMLTVITAVLVNREVSGQESIVALLLKTRGLDFRSDPVSQSLRRISVMAAMNRQFVEAEKVLRAEQIRHLLQSKPDWILVRRDQGNAFVVSAADVLRALNQAEQADPEQSADDIQLDLAAIPADRRQCVPVHLRASLQEALETFEQTGAEALHVERQTIQGSHMTYGILTRKAVEKAYRL